MIHHKKPVFIAAAILKGKWRKTKESIEEG